MSTRGRAVRSAAVVTVVVALVGCDRWEKQLASSNAAGTDSADAVSLFPHLSDDGTKVAFLSSASNLGPVDGNGLEDVYVRDLATGTTELVSVNAAGTGSGNARSYSPWVSPDGTRVTFTSDATDLASPVPGNGQTQLYMRDLTSDTTTMISVNADGTGGGDKGSHIGTLSPDGTRVLFSSDADNLAGSPSEATTGVYLRDLQTNQTTKLADGGAGPFSPQGDAVAYSHEREVYVRDLTAGTVTHVSAGGPGRANGGPLAFNSTGRKIAYTRETNVDFVREDIYVYDRDTRTSTLATPAVVGGGGADNTPTTVLGFHPTDPNRLLFSSTADNLVTIPTTRVTQDIFVRDLAARRTTLLSVSKDGTRGANRSTMTAAWAGGGKVAFVSLADDLGPTDTNGWWDVYVRDLASGTNTLVSSNAAGDNGGNGDSGRYQPLFGVTYYIGALSVSADGTRVAFGSNASNLGPVDHSRSCCPRGEHDIYVADLVTPPPS